MQAGQLQACLGTAARHLTCAMGNKKYDPPVDDRHHVHKHNGHAWSSFAMARLDGINALTCQLGLHAGRAAWEGVRGTVKDTNYGLHEPPPVSRGWT